MGLWCNLRTYPTYNADVVILIKAITYKERSKMKRYPTKKQSFSEDCFFSGISLHFRLFVLRYGFSGFQQNKYQAFYQERKENQNYLLFKTSVFNSVSSALKVPQASLKPPQKKISRHAFKFFVCNTLYCSTE